MQKYGMPARLNASTISGWCLSGERSRMPISSKGTPDSADFPNVACYLGALQRFAQRQRKSATLPSGSRTGTGRLEKR